jgi:3-oxoacyl-[acyl-carrier protein] reductase
VSLLLEGKRAFITGGTRGIGAAICEIFAREGADVAFSYNSREDLAAEISQKIEAHGGKAFSAKVSVVDRVGMKKLTRELVEKWGGIDILVNNAAINRGDNFATTTDRAWDEVIHTNVDSLFAVTKPIYKQMIRQRKGIILNITSIGAMRALPTAVHYATSKAAMIGFTKCLSREAARSSDIWCACKCDCGGNLRYRSCSGASGSPVTDARLLDLSRQAWTSGRARGICGVHGERAKQLHERRSRHC